MKAVWLCLVKAVLSIGDWFGQKVFFQDEAGPVEPVRADIPYGAHRLQRLDVFRPAGPGPHPVLVYIHGGGWLAGDKRVYTPLSRAFAERGFLVFNINYRLAPDFHFPAQVQDAVQAIAWVQAHAGEYGGDPRRIFLSGESAGAHLALWYATGVLAPERLEAVGIREALPPDAIQGLVLFFGLYDLEREKSGLARMFIEGFLGDGVEAVSRLASPIHGLRPELAPVLAICGERDLIYAQSVALVEALEGCGARYQKLFFSREEYPDAGHAFSKWPGRKCTQEAVEAAVRFMGKLGD